MQHNIHSVRLMMAAGVLIGLVLLTAASFVRPQDQKASVPEDSLKNFLRGYLRDAHYDYKMTRYVSAFVDLKDDGTQQVIVYFTDRNSCGSSGCTTLILAAKGSSYKVVTSIPIAWAPIRILNTKSNGWHDLGVWVQGGGIQPGYEAKLSFNGNTYPSNPTVPPARRLHRKVPGKVVIHPDAKGIGLYE
jgi:hypothetical protein